MAKNMFNASIHTIRTDGGGEFSAHDLREFLATNGIQHQLSCPYTPEQNGVAERKHRHITETARTLLAQSALPESFWSDAVATSVHLINRLPSKSCGMMSPFQKLYNRLPDYSYLRVFGAVCYPWLANRRPHKLSPTASKCIFIGYSLRHKGYRCFDPLTHKILISRHVTFQEDIKPYNPIPQPIPPATQPFNPLLFIPTTTSTEQPPTEPDQTYTAPTQVLSPTPHTQPNITPPQSSNQLAEPPTAPDPPSQPSPLKPPAHQMLTRFKSGKLKPKAHLSLHTTISETEPTTYKQACIQPVWQKAMDVEFRTLQDQHTWKLVSPPKGHPIIGSKWTYKIKRKADGSIDRYKSRLVAQGYSQVYGIDYEEIFSPVAKCPTIRLLFTLAFNRNWHITQVDVSNTFLNGSLNETVYMKQPPEFIDPVNPSAVCLLQKSIYGLKQSPRQWNSALTAHLRSIRFTLSTADPSLFIRHDPDGATYVLVYVDDLLITGSSKRHIDNTVAHLQQAFQIRNLGSPSTFLGLHIDRHQDSWFIHQKSYALTLLQTAGMQDCKAVSTPTTSHSSRSSSTATDFHNPSLYRKLAGSLQYLTLTRPDIAFAVNQVCQHMHHPLDQHYDLIIRILRYLKGTLGHGIPIVRGPPDLVGYTDSDWTGDIEDRKSTTVSCIFFANTLISWKVQKQKTVARSSTEAEYRALAITVTDIIWFRRLLHEFGFHNLPPTNIFCDNLSTLTIAANPVLRARTKHIEIDHHFIREHILAGKIFLQYIPTGQQVADILTKGLSKYSFQLTRDKLTVRSSADHLAGGC